MDKKNQIKAKLILGVLCLIVCLVWLAVFNFPDTKLHLIFCNVGQGDAILITKGFDQILIDGGPNEKVLDCLAKNMPFWDKKIEIIALSHPEADHLTGLLSVLDKYKTDYFLTGPEGSESAGYQVLVDKLETHGFCKVSPCGTARRDLMKVFNPYTGKKIKLGDITLESLWPEREWAGAVLGASTTTKNLNDFSLVFLLSYRGKKILLMGDADSKVQYRFIDNLTALPIDILKLPHHGSKTGITEKFLQKISPKEAVISVGKNSFGHPTQEALDMLNKFGVLIRRTDLEGDINYKF